ncbi:MAG: SDR family oxidoreductase [Candidatus Omnitrophica bacterium]|nr:SDR family oxidoreductase [Candidatus Omnitrophota bacterium]
MKARPPRNLFVTGATGGIGRELVRMFLEETPDRLFLLVRAKNSDSEEVRIEKLLKKIGTNGASKDRIRVVSGDLTQPRLGLSPGDWETVTRQTDEFYHIAALTNLGAEWDLSEKINLHGTNCVLETAKEALRSGRLKRFFYFSTAYVAGSFTRICSLEDELPENPSFANNYEATKYLAEKRVREEMAQGLPAVIFRPSIVVGDSKRGAVSEFKVIYPFWRLFAHGLLKKLPSRLENSFNIVPIDFVVEAAFHLSRRDDSVGKTFHLVTENPPTLGLLLRVKEEFGISSPVEVIPPEEFSVETLDPFEREIFSKIDPYLGYLTSSLSFDTQNARKFLRGTGTDFPKTDRNFLKKVLGYALEKGYFLKLTA